jgi:predicted nucleotidyltransferase
MSYHKNKVKKEKENIQIRNEELRKQLLNKTIHLLSDYFARFPHNMVYLFGSITKENQFSRNSDIDIAVANHPGQRIALFCEIEELLHHKIDLVYLEKCSFSNHITTHGIKINQHGKIFNSL